MEEPLVMFSFSKKEFVRRGVEWRRWLVSAVTEEEADERDPDPGGRLR